MTKAERFREMTGIDRATIDAHAARHSLDGVHRRKDVQWKHMSINLRGESKSGETFALSLAGEPTKAQLRALLALLAKDDE